MKKKDSKGKRVGLTLLSLFLFLFLFNLVSASLGYDDESLPQLIKGKYVLNTGDSVTGRYDFNGGWQGNGLSIIDGDIYAQTGYFYNITSLNVTKQNLTINDNLLVLGNVSFLKNFSVDTSTFFINSNNDRIGIGTTSPSATLEVNGNILLPNNVYLQMKNSVGTAQNVFKLDGSNHLQLLAPAAIYYDANFPAGGNLVHIFRYPSSTARMVIDGNGNVGIGTITPDSLLEVNGTVKFTNQADNLASLIWSPTAEGGAGTLTAGYYYSYNGYRSVSNNNLTLQQHGTAQSILFNIGGSNTKAIIDSSGRFGINTTSPQNTLNVKGDSNTTGVSYSGNFTLSNGGVVWGNSTCTFISSPDGSTRQEICNV